MVFQHFNLFSHKTVLENVMYAPVKVKKRNKGTVYMEAMDILEVVGLAEKKDVYPEMLSGGQKQRLTIARAVVKKPEFLILDDRASALDFATDAALRKSLHQLSGNVTTFLVSQRAASIRQADLILVLNDGELVGKGIHDDLIRSCEIYREIYFSQFPEERAKYDSSKTAVSGNAAEVTLS